MKNRFALVAVAALFSSSVFAQVKNLPPALSAAAAAGQVEVVNKFDAGSGLTGYVLKSKGNHSIGYVSADGKKVIIGTMFSDSAENLTEAHFADHVPAKTYNEFISKLEKTTLITEGNGKGPVVYALLDPNCVFCHYAHEAFAPYVKAGLTVKWLPVAFLNETSAGKAAAMIQAKNPALVLNEHQSQFKSGGVTPVTPTAKTLKALDDNNALMQEMGFRGTPAILYKDSKGRWVAKDGMPKLSELPRITGLPAQKHTNPDLDRFR